MVAMDRNNLCGCNSTSDTVLQGARKNNILTQIFSLFDHNLILFVMKNIYLSIGFIVIIGITNVTGSSNSLSETFNSEYKSVESLEKLSLPTFEQLSEEYFNDYYSNRDFSKTSPKFDEVLSPSLSFNTFPVNSQAYDSGPCFSVGGVVISGVLIGTAGWGADRLIYKSYSDHPTGTYLGWVGISTGIIALVMAYSCIFNK
jgi:hypothetical protein